MGTLDMARTAGFAFLLLVVACCGLEQKHLQLLRAISDCESVTVPGSAFLEVKERVDPAETSYKDPVGKGLTEHNSDGTVSHEPHDEGNYPPTKHNDDLDNPNNAANSFGVYVPGQTPHVKVSIGDLPARDQGTPTVIGKGVGQKLGNAPQIMFSDNDMDVESPRLWAVSVLRALGSNAPNATCYCHYTDKKSTGETFDEMNCLCKNRASKPLCRLEEMFDKYAEANLGEVVQAAKAKTERALAAAGLASPPPTAGNVASDSPLEPKHKSKAMLSAEAKCASKTCKNACMMHGVCLCGKCICEPGLKGEDCSVGLQGATMKKYAPDTKATELQKVTDPTDENSPGKQVLIDDNPLLHVADRE